MENTERQVLLSNILDSLDRLFDGEIEAEDVYAIVFATAHALLEDRHSSLLRQAALELANLVMQGQPAGVERERAIEATNGLRLALAEDVGLS